MAEFSFAIFILMGDSEHQKGVEKSKFKRHQAGMKRKRNTKERERNDSPGIDNNAFLTEPIDLLTPHGKLVELDSIMPRVITEFGQLCGFCRIDREREVCEVQGVAYDYLTFCQTLPSRDRARGEGR